MQAEGDRPIRAKKAKTYEEEDADLQNQPYKKKKKTKDSKQKKGGYDGKLGGSEESMQLYNIMKRPRGRPPLISNKIKLMPKPTMPLRPFLNAVSSTSGATPKAALSSSSSQPKFPATFQLNGPAAEPEAPKQARPSALVVANRVFTKLMTSDPLSTADLTKLLDAPRDLIQSVLDVMQVMGVVISLKLKDGYSGSSVSGANLYSLANFTKSPTAVQLNALVDEVAIRIENTNRNQQRIKELQELTTKEMSAADRTEALRALIDKFLLQQPNLWDDPMYRAIIEHTGNTFQFSKSAVSSPRQ